MKTFSLDKIKIHQKSLAHKEAEQQELLVSSQAQPDLHLTQHKELNKHQIAIQNLMRACVFLCQQDISLNAFPSLCILLETSGVTLLPAETSGVSYRNKEAALCFTQHIASYLHEELLEKVKASPVVGKLTVKHLSLISAICSYFQDGRRMTRHQDQLINHALFMCDTSKTSKQKLLTMGCWISTVMAQRRIFSKA